MTKKELIEALEPYDDDTEVYIWDNGTEMYIDKLKDTDLGYNDGNIYIYT